jgi:HEPN domain-containing protein
MSPTKNEVIEWLQKAEQDLIAARVLLKNIPPVLEPACFHCQQTVEKVLKAFLVWKSVPFEEVHSLNYLMDLCELQDSRFALLRSTVETLSPYAVKIRYPSRSIVVTQTKAQESLAIAESIWEFILEIIPKY